MKQSLLLTRRAVLGASCGTAALFGSGLTSLETVADSSVLPEGMVWKDPDTLTVHSAHTLETHNSALNCGVITPTRRLFVRNNLSAPPASIVAEPDAWMLRVSGVKSPAQLSVGQLKKIGLAVLPMVLQCSGNGRKFFAHQPSGTAWGVGGAGCVMWGGVPVSDVVESLGGVDPQAAYMTGTGGEPLPDVVDLKALQVERSVPLAALNCALLAWELNGEPIPLAHGGPLRLVVPGYCAVNSIKYVQQLAFTPTQSGAAIQQSRYRMAAIGQKGHPDQPSAWQMAPKSWINSPSARDGVVSAGKVWVLGVAMGGMEAVEQVEITLDDGRTWQVAAFVGPDLGPYAWRGFAVSVELSPGVQRIASRCRDINGVQQMEQRIENEGGYLNSSWRDHTVELQVS